MDELEQKDGKFFYKSKKLIVDLYTSVDFRYDDLGVGKLLMGAKEIPLTQCEAVFKEWFLYGGVLRRLPDEAHIPYNPPCQILPFLILRDRSGAFADLWMEYG
jgi:hypothetical protein